MKKAWPSFSRATRGLLDSRVRVTAERVHTGLMASNRRPGGVVIDNMPASIQPVSTTNVQSFAGNWTSATMVMFCPGVDANGNKIAIRKGHKVEELENGNVKRLWEVSDDPENFVNVFLRVPLKPTRVVSGGSNA